MRRSLSAVLLMAIVTSGQTAMGAKVRGQHITDAEIAQVPKFCWRLLGVPNLPNSPEFTFQRCGGWMNHYCGGLVQLARAKRLTYDPGKMAGPLSAAAQAINYTEEHTKDQPNCSVRSHIEATKLEIRHLEMMYGTKKSGKKKRAQ